MAGRQKEPGPTSERVAANLRHIRQERGLGYAELSRQLAGTGHPILDTGLMKIEKGQRRVDVDDLMALALALGVTPNRLLLPAAGSANPRESFTITPGSGKVRAADSWAWANGERPLGHDPASLADREPATDELEFTAENRRYHVTGQETVGPQDAGLRAQGSGLITAAILGAYIRFGLDTREIRGAADSAVTAALTTEESATAGRDVLEVLEWLVAAARTEERAANEHL